ncbi:four helix bundle protein [Pedobacter sp. BS3]|uniref:four helix bundle protein n=1 Tax=Pedobacter sp. BS3 TaxID=2567937 RepID=UPI0011ED8928|nr:four helix bundle protein [Pedobacter sp. BS3]TZF81042.1 four helix bundle protein [Pedobacter sp. BS3]
MHNIKELKVWSKAIDLAIRIYEISAQFPSDERFGLTSQVRRCAVSISSNISEGAGRNTKGEFIQFLGIANGSSYELQTQIVIAEKLGFIDSNLSSEILKIIDELQKMNYKLQKSLMNSNH